MAGTISFEASQHAAKRFRDLLRHTYAQWEVCGHVRRRAEGLMALEHVVIPRASMDMKRFDNAVWERLEQLLAAKQLTLAAGMNGELFRPEHDSIFCSIMDPHGWQHRIVLATAETWAVRLAERTGPPAYWSMLLWRLKRAGTLTLRAGLVCVIDRSGLQEQLAPIECPCERTFFRLARTPYKQPGKRFARIPAGTLGQDNWPLGMLPEWYPPGVKIYVPPGGIGYDSSKPIPEQFRSSEDRWRYS